MMFIKNEIKTYLDTLLKKYDYSFNGQLHIHSIGDMKLTSVTKFISETGEPFDEDAVIEKIIVNESSVYYQLEPKFIKSQWGALRRLGTNAHKRVELWLKQLINDNEFKYTKFFRENNLTHENCLSETPVFNKLYRLGGNIDIIQIEEEDDKIVLSVYDVKTSGGISENEEKLIAASYQIYIYSLLLKALMRGFNKQVEVKRGKIISIESDVKDLRIPIDVHDLEQFKPPILLNTVLDGYDFIKNKMIERKIV